MKKYTLPDFTQTEQYLLYVDAWREGCREFCKSSDVSLVMVSADTITFATNTPSPMKFTVPMEAFIWINKNLNDYRKRNKQRNESVKRAYQRDPSKFRKRDAKWKARQEELAKGVKDATTTPLP